MINDYEYSISATKSRNAFIPRLTNFVWHTGDYIFREVCLSPALPPLNLARCLSMLPVAKTEGKWRPILVFLTDSMKYKQCIQYRSFKK